MDKWPIKNINLEEENIQEIIPLYKMFQMIDERTSFEECLMPKRTHESETSSFENEDLTDSYCSYREQEKEEFKRNLSPGLKKL